MARTKRSYMKNNKLFLSIDDIGRIIIPNIFLSAKEKNCINLKIYTKDRKIYMERTDKKISKSYTDSRIVIPCAIRRLLNINSGDYLEFKAFDDYFILEPVEEKEIEQE